ncbi:MAG: DUF2478 domain-containing protein [Proteobacteria bacterium]|nr:DUF2478 domain-containing protein [Pseudomonadota bacterium]MBS0573452.1 DUF2478 domain-containing protein [Pseudomonadota bacterium]
MKLGFVRLEGPGATDAFLSAMAGHLSSCGFRLAGTVQINTDRECGHLCDMDLLLLPDGPEVRISQNLGTGSTGCRLDAGALEQAVAIARARLGNADLLIVNKFGKHEAEGRGFRELIAEALAAGLPVLIGVNPQNFAAFQDFCGGAAVPLPAEPGTIAGWLAADPVAA